MRFFLMLVGLGMNGLPAFAAPSICPANNIDVQKVEYSRKQIESYRGKAARELYTNASLTSVQILVFDEPPPLLRYVEFQRRIEGKIRTIRIEFNPNKTIIRPLRREVLEQSAHLTIHSIWIVD